MPPGAGAEIKTRETRMRGPPDAGPRFALRESSKLSGVLCHYQAFHIVFLQNIKANTVRNQHSEM